MRNLVAVLMVTGLVMAGCGGTDLGVDAAQDTSPSSDQGSQETQAGAGESGDDAGQTSADDPTPEGSGPLDVDSIRIGSNVWHRTLPMTRGQCFLQPDDGTLPDSGVAWGTLDNDDNLSYAANYNQDATFEAEVSSDTMFWVAGVRTGSELSIELDFAADTIRGEGLFNNLHTDEWAYGSFQFTCDEG